MVNYVLAHEKCNDEKGDNTPYQWLHGREGWDAYVRLEHFLFILSHIERDGRNGCNGRG